MDFTNFVLENDEKIIFRLRELYKNYGYVKYRMSKFEEYDFYARNKDFLISDNVITLLMQTEDLWRLSLTLPFR